MHSTPANQIGSAEEQHEIYEEAEKLKKKDSVVINTLEAANDKWFEHIQKNAH